MVERGIMITYLKEITELLREIRDAVKPKPSWPVRNDDGIYPAGSDRIDWESATEPSQPEPPSWADIPAEYLWRAQDENGEWCAYRQEPRCSGVHHWFLAEADTSGFYKARKGNGDLNPNWRQTKERRPEPVAEPDWSKAPEWAEWGFVASSGPRIWCEQRPMFDSVTWRASGGRVTADMDERHLVRGIDWKQTLRQRPKPVAKPEPDWTPPPWSECPEDAEWMVLSPSGHWLATVSLPRLSETKSYWHSMDAKSHVIRYLPHEPPRHIWQSSRMRRPEK